MDDELAGVREILGDEPDELDRINSARDEARKLILNMLRAPWCQMSAFAISNACHYLEHPSRYDEKEGPCPCGRYKAGRPITAPGER